MTKVQELKTELEQRYPRLIHYLKPGIDAAMLQQKFAELGLYPSSTMLEFYAWTTWVDFDSVYADEAKIEYTLFEGYYPSPFDIDNLRENIITSAGHSYWSFMQDDFGDFFAEKMSAEPQQTALIYHVPEGFDALYPDEGNDVITAFASFDQFIETVLALFKAGAVFYIEEHGVDIMESSEAAGEIGMRLNPQMEYWHG